MRDYSISEDYASVSGGVMGFYFGYEETLGDGDNAEWCFVATESSREVMRVPRSKLGVSSRSSMEEYLLAGIAKWLEEFN